MMKQKKKKFTVQMQKTVNSRNHGLVLFDKYDPYQVLPLSGPGSNGNEGVPCIPQSSSITGTSPLDCLVSYPLVCVCGGGVLPPCREAVSVFYSFSRPGKFCMLALVEAFSAQ